MSARAKDIELWEKWKRSRSQQDLQALLDHLQPVISQQVNRWSGSRARPMLEMQAKVLATEAIKSYNPARGAALATHVTNRLQKLSRTVYTHTQAARLPEHKAIGMASYSVAQDALQSELGREPSHAEMADHLGWSVNRVGAFQKAYERRELLASGDFNPSKFPIADEQDPIIGFVYHDMAPKTQKLFESITGYNGAPVMSNKQLMRKFKMTQGQVSYQKRKLKNLFKDALKEGV
jgi:hypothetical protein